MYRFTDSLPFLLNRVGVRMGELFAAELAADNVTVPMYRVLAALTEADDQRLTDLSRLTSVEVTTLSRLVAGMEKRGMLRRRRPEDNLRTIQIGLTGAGRDLAARLCPRAAHYEQVAMQDLRAVDVKRLKAMLAKVYDSLDELEREQSGPPSRQARTPHKAA